LEILCTGEFECTGSAIVAQQQQQFVFNRSSTDLLLSLSSSPEIVSSSEIMTDCYSPFEIIPTPVPSEDGGDEDGNNSKQQQSGSRMKKVKNLKEFLNLTTKSSSSSSSSSCHSSAFEASGESCSSAAGSAPPAVKIWPVSSRIRSQPRCENLDESGGGGDDDSGSNDDDHEIGAAAGGGDHSWPTSDSGHGGGCRSNNSNKQASCSSSMVIPPPMKAEVKTNGQQEEEGEEETSQQQSSSSSSNDSGLDDRDRAAVQLMANNSCEEVTETSKLLPGSGQEEETLPSPDKLGCGHPFLVFLCLTLLLQHRDLIMKQAMDYNELAMYFDKLVRKHNVSRVLNQARAMYSQYLSSFPPPPPQSSAATSSSDYVMPNDTNSDNVAVDLNHSKC
jgi:hypothetical protein